MGLVTQKLVKEFFTYNPDSGTLISNGRSREWFKSIGSYNAFNSRYKGKEVGWADKDGYKVVSFLGNDYRTHRLAYFYMEGRWPENDIDHQNGIRDDNRWCNIRSVDRYENTRNACVRSDNKSGVAGVGFASNINKWRARINTRSTKSKHLGVFVNWFDAVCARKSAENKYGYHVNHGRMPSGGVSSH